MGSDSRARLRIDEVEAGGLFTPPFAKGGVYLRTTIMEKMGQLSCKYPVFQHI